MSHPIFDRTPVRSVKQRRETSKNWLKQLAVEQLEERQLPTCLVAPSSDVAYLFLRSPEHRALTVSGAYLHLLHRLPAGEEINAWVQAWDSWHLSREQLDAYFVASQEFGGSLDDQDWLKTVYFYLLDRDPDALGEAAFLTALGQGSSRFQVALAITTSNEQMSRYVVGYYVESLGRVPSFVEGMGWLLARRSGLTDEQARAQFVLSDEYYNEHAHGNAPEWVRDLYFLFLHRGPDQHGYHAILSLLCQ